MANGDDDIDIIISICHRVWVLDVLDTIAWVDKLHLWWISFTSTDSDKCNGSTVADFSTSSSLFCQISSGFGY
jgi:hypothetical protein